MWLCILCPATLSPCYVYVLGLDLKSLIKKCFLSSSCFTDLQAFLTKLSRPFYLFYSSEQPIIFSLKAMGQIFFSELLTYITGNISKKNIVFFCQCLQIIYEIFLRLMIFGFWHTCLFSDYICFLIAIRSLTETKCYRFSLQ